MDAREASLVKAQGASGATAVLLVAADIDVEAGGLDSGAGELPGEEVLCSLFLLHWF